MRRRWTLLVWLILPAFLLLAGTTVKRGPGQGGNSLATLSGGVANTTGSTFTVTFPDIDDEPGVANGAGADAAPHPGSQVGKVRFNKARSEPNTNMMNTLAEIITYNNSGVGVFENPNLPADTLQYEFSFEGSGGARSGAPWTEFYWQHTPSSYWITFANTTTTATSTLSDQYTFTGGENCRAMQTGVSLDFTASRWNCLDGDAPDAADFVLTCTGTCTGDETGAQVSTAVLDGVTRPFFYEYFSSINRVSWRQNRGRDGTGQVGVYIAGNGNTGQLYLGRLDETDTDSIGVNIPHENIWASDVNNAQVFRGGSIGIDTSDDGGASGYWVFVAGNTYDGTEAYGIHPTTTQCFEHTDLDSGDDNRVIPITGYQRIKVVAFGCGNNTDTAAATVTDGTLSLEDGTGNAITLSGTLTCSGSDQAVAWVTVDPVADTDAVLTSGERLRFDSGAAPDPATPEITVCVAYQYWKV